MVRTWLQIFRPSTFLYLLESFSFLVTKQLKSNLLLGLYSTYVEYSPSKIQKGDASIRFGVKTSIDGKMRSSSKTDEDSVWRPRLLSCWPQMLEQTSCCSAYCRLD